MLLFSQRRALRAGRETPVAEYRPAVFWWELVLISQKLVFVGFMSEPAASI